MDALVTCLRLIVATTLTTVLTLSLQAPLDLQVQARPRRPRSGNATHVVETQSAKPECSSPSGDARCVSELLD
jgi:hypothetical protein